MCGTSTCDPLGVPSALRVGNNLGNLKSIQSRTHSLRFRDMNLNKNAFKLLTKESNYTS